MSKQKQEKTIWEDERIVTEPMRDDARGGHCDSGDVCYPFRRSTND